MSLISPAHFELFNHTGNPSIPQFYYRLEYSIMNGNNPNTLQGEMRRCVMTGTGAFDGESVTLDRRTFYEEQLPYLAGSASKVLTQRGTFVDMPTAPGNATASSDGLMSKEDKAKLDEIAEGSNKTVVDSALSTTSTNPVQNKVVKKELDKKLDKSGGTMTGPLTYGNDNTTNNPNRYVSAGGGYTVNVGKNGLKVLVNDQIDAQCGFGADLTGINYELSIAAPQDPNNANNANITFSKHLCNTKTYTRLGLIDGQGNLDMVGEVRSGGKRCVTEDELPGPHVVAHGVVSADGTVTFYYGEGQMGTHTTGVYKLIVTGGLIGRILLAFPMQDGFYLSQAALSGGMHTITTYKNGTKTDCGFCFIVYAMN